MIPNEQIAAQLSNCLLDTDFLTDRLGSCKRGKVRDTYDLGDKLLLITTDRQSAFDRVLAAVPCKGAVLNGVTNFWFEKTRNIVPNHLLNALDPNAVLARKCEVLPVEFVVRGYLTGSTSTSAWTLYNKGERTICGNVLPDGMVKNQKFKKPILTPTTKNDVHDESISAQEIISQGILDQKTWDQASEIAFALFNRGMELAARNGLILVDTKYEFGKDRDGTIVLIDEIHTPDSSRYWLKDSYQSRLANGQEPENIDKEFLRLWFKENCDPYNDSTLPNAPADLVVELSRRYQQLYEMITGSVFSIEPGVDIQQRLAKNIESYIK